jgi:hypothetical protein
MALPFTDEIAIRVEAADAMPDDFPSAVPSEHRRSGETFRLVAAQGRLGVRRQ